MMTYQAKVLSITPNNTLLVEVRLGFGVTIKTDIVIDCCVLDDEPETRDALVKLLKFRKVELENVCPVEGSRFLSDVILNGENVGLMLIEQGIARVPEEEQ